jgi:ribose transport system substrate-binding protein
MDAQAMTPVISSAFQKGIPVVLIGRTITTQDYTCFIAPDNRQIARQAAIYMAQKMEGKGRILMLKGVDGATSTIYRTQGFLQQIKSYGGIEIAVVKTANYLRNDAIMVMEEVLEKDQKFDAIYAQSDSMATGARMALKMAGKDPKKFLMVGIDYISEARQAIRIGEQSASFTYPTCGKQGAQAALKILKEEKVPKQIRIESIMITKDNVEKINPIF